MGTSVIIDQNQYRETVTRLSREIPLEENGCFHFFAVQALKLHKRAGIERLDAILGVKFDVFNPLVTAHEALLRTAYRSCGETTQSRMRTLVEILRAAVVKN
ncbi:MAG: hypothetical protein UV00_C0032G0006 [candidate division WWE3 bacterium GW2011_GWF1_42_14]|uniref:Uncharacterized protein n=1 Tax=candidate division WWE3 bacterium GW2011_GWF1_42_14 TaxID=1619138 RepID=A0A0G0YG42_UNCKA|nr:MAG: hypothetical protein UV00_C0032G0006 [candidate division WWE3 bacterium GW2011_GWF1_42_14]